MAILKSIRRWLVRGHGRPAESSDAVAAYYDPLAQHEWERHDRVPMEYELTRRAMREFLPPVPAHIADVGGGPGWYSIALARQGYAVTLVDVSASSLAMAEKKAAEAGVKLEQCLHASALDLSCLSAASFDGVLLMGPLYHLLEHAQRVQALAQAHRLLRPGGMLLAALLSRFSMIQFLLAQRPEGLPQRREAIDEILRSGVWRRPAGESGFIDAWFAHPDQVPALMAEGGFADGKLLAVQPLAGYADQNLKRAAPELRTQWMDLLYRLAPEPSLHGASDHLLYVSRKTANP